MSLGEKPPLQQPLCSRSAPLLQRRGDSSDRCSACWSSSADGREAGDQREASC